jgi:hypothetical protein
MPLQPLLVFAVKGEEISRGRKGVMWEVRKKISRIITDVKPA